MNETTAVMIASIIASFTALGGVIFQAYLQYKSSRATKATESEKAAKEEAEAAKKEKEKAQAALDEERREKVYGELRDGIKKVSDDIGEMHKSMDKMNARIDRIHTTLNGKLHQTEESIDKITVFLTQYSNGYTAMQSMQKKTDAYIQQLLTLETHNLKFTSDISEVLLEFIEALGKLPQESEETKAKIQKVSDHIGKTRQQFFNAMMQGNVDGIAHPPTTDTIAGVPDSSDIAAIMKRRMEAAEGSTE